MINNLADAAPTKTITRKTKTRKFYEEEEKDSDAEERFDGGRMLHNVCISVIIYFAKRRCFLLRLLLFLFF